MLIPVRPCVFMPETHHMTQLMSHNTKLVTVLSNGYSLRAPSSATHIWATPGKENPQTHAAHQLIEEDWDTGTEDGIWQGPGQASSCIHCQFLHVHVCVCIKKTPKCLPVKMYIYTLSVIPAKRTQKVLALFWASAQLSWQSSLEVTRCVSVTDPSRQLSVYSDQH